MPKKNITVLKFGGTSVANAVNIQKVLDVVEGQPGDKAVIVSALAGITDLLLQTASLAAEGNKEYLVNLEVLEKRHLEIIHELLPIKGRNSVISEIKRQLNTLESHLEGIFLLKELTPKTHDLIGSFGEILSSYCIYEIARQRAMDVCYVNAKELIRTMESQGKTLVDLDRTYSLCQSFFEQNQAEIYLMPGFIASGEDGRITTLGRGGSDYTAALVAAALHAQELQIWTDVKGMYTANPKLVKQAHPIDHLSYQEAMELSHFGAKVIYPPTIQPAMEKNIPIWIKDTFHPESHGTLITKETGEKERPVRGISHIESIALLTLEGSGMVGIPGISKRLFEALFLGQINIILITQASSEHSICIAVNEADIEKAKKAVDEAFEFEISKGKISPAVVEKGQAIIALVGDKMKSHQGLSGRMFSTLGRNNVNVRAIAQGASEKNISAVIQKSDVSKALNSLHEHFFEENIKQVNLFITGVGMVGEKFLNQIKGQSKYIRNQLKLSIRVIALANSRKMCFNPNGIDLEKWQEQLEQGEQSDALVFFQKSKKLNLRNSVFVDNTANEHISDMYGHYLKESIAVVTCNKIACADAYENYKKLKELSSEYGAPFLFETNVGAGLPIIDTLQNLILSGDKVRRIDAVLSGSLNFIFNTYNEAIPFHRVVKQAKALGYTEPDPRIDLSGVDVARKILILARESNHIMELEDIENRSFLPSGSNETADVDTFLDFLEKNEAHFLSIYRKATGRGCRLKYVASLIDGKARVGLREIPWGDEFYELEGSDNVVAFYTDRYPKQPLVVKGAGAGADVTAMGVFADIIRVAKMA